MIRLNSLGVLAIPEFGAALLGWVDAGGLGPAVQRSNPDVPRAVNRLCISVREGEPVSKVASPLGEDLNRRPTEAQAGSEADIVVLKRKGRDQVLVTPVLEILLEVTDYFSDTLLATTSNNVRRRCREPGAAVERRLMPHLTENIPANVDPAFYRVTEEIIGIANQLFGRPHVQHGPCPGPSSSWGD